MGHASQGHSQCRDDRSNTATSSFVAPSLVRRTFDRCTSCSSPSAAACREVVLPRRVPLDERQWFMLGLSLSLAVGWTDLWNEGGRGGQICFLSPLWFSHDGRHRSVRSTNHLLTACTTQNRCVFVGGCRRYARSFKVSGTAWRRGHNGESV